MSPVILDTDIGVDDCVALRYALVTQELIGCTCTYGNVAVTQAVSNCRFTLQHYGRAEIPVFQGASRPLSRRPLPLATHIHGPDGLGGCNPGTPAEQAPGAVSFIIDAARRHPGEVTLLTIGPLTNLAIALNLCPELPNLLKAVVCMAGAFGTHGHSGNMTPFAEFNMYNDPEAAELVFASALPLTVIPLDVTHQVLVSSEELAACGDRFLCEVAAGYLEFSRKTEGFSGMAVHDALTVGYLLHPEHFTTVSTPLAVSCAGVTDGQSLRPLTDYAAPADAFAGRPRHQVCLGVDAPAAKAALLAALTGA